MADLLRNSLPALVPRYNGVPRRYEETKPAHVQNFTHKRIVGIGKDIQRRLLDSIESEKLEALRKAESAVWDQAKQEKQEAVLKARNEEKAKAEKLLQRKIKEYEQLIKEECVKVEVALMKQMAEQVKEERLKGEKALAEAVAAAEEKGRLELLEAVATARVEEKKIAADTEAALKSAHAAEVDHLKKTMTEDKRKALEQMKATKDQERVRAVKEAQEFTQKVADKRAQEIRDTHKLELAKMDKIIGEWQQEVKGREVIIAQLERAKKNISDKLLEVKFYFQDFINRVKIFEAGQSDYMLPPMYLEEIERKGVLSKPL
ncbi:chromosome 6 open reading frame 163 [Elysia marginata]|uniref:Chromosome 6 open reading frame 163 n=1 Tax=Elysia marginata TaxID=1093978 RepID=A0AAV4EVT8_9GAST|nr:chromosome 6 open reading frame 163 [Elysia marginata]